MSVGHHLEVSLVVNSQLVIVLDPWWELHAIRYVIELDLIRTEADAVLSDVQVLCTVENLSDFVAESGSVDDPQLTDLVITVRPGECAVLYTRLEAKSVVLQRCGHIVQTEIVTKDVIATIDFFGDVVNVSIEHVIDFDVGKGASKHLVLDICSARIDEQVNIKVSTPRVLVVGHGLTLAIFSVERNEELLPVIECTEAIGIVILACDDR